MREMVLQIVCLSIAKAEVCCCIVFAYIKIFKFRQIRGFVLLASDLERE